MNTKPLFSNIAFIIVDILYLFLSGIVALWVRFEFNIDQIPANYMNEYLRVSWIFVATFLALYSIFRLYRSVWRYASMMEVIRIVFAYMTAVPVIVIEIFIFKINLPRSTYVLMYLLDIFWCVFVRFFFRFTRYIDEKMKDRQESEDNVMVIGAGDAARALIADMSTSDKVHYHVVCIIDDNRELRGKYIGSIPIVGTRDDIPEMCEKYDIGQIIFAIPSISNKERADILEICSNTGCRIRVIPGIYQLVNGEVSVSGLRDIDVVDLLGRSEVKVDNKAIFEKLEGKTIMVTGGGGSIGAELCRQIAMAGPARLIIFDIYENNAYEIQNELWTNFPELDLVTLIGSVRSSSRVDSILDEYRPDYIFHAAAHKHVPLMEDSPCEAIKNNCMGTFNMARAAAEYGVSRFLLISTDKAVNPTNVMGASKRVCEMIIQMFDRRCPDTSFCAVRFGNVLGSNGSVIPLFREQIAAGGPVTVTDKRMIRYFMTIPEAVSLVLQSFDYAKGGEIFVLDMGEPVKIDEMARRMIELSGLKPDIDIEIRYTGLRPGEKLFEELLIDDERMKRTENKLIFIEEPFPMDDDLFVQELRELNRYATAEDPEVRRVLQRIVPTFHSQETYQ